MSRWKSLVLAALLCGATLPAGVLADEASHRQAVEQLFELTAMQQKIDESVDSVLALQLSQSPELRPHQEVVREFLERHIGWASLRDALTDMYLQEFSEEEVQAMNTFYRSPAGRKVIERLPVLVQMRNQLASQRLQENIGELRYLIEARRKEQPEESHP
ncbi:MAG: DUF2059 domain-containing protein [Gammaproteobacteria bacterium]|jgi:hypothetical protein